MFAVKNSPEFDLYNRFKVTDVRFGFDDKSDYFQETTCGQVLGKTVCVPTLENAFISSVTVNDPSDVKVALKNSPEFVSMTCKKR
jgi:hypothetical protein